MSTSTSRRAAWLAFRLPRRSIRLRLTLLYGALLIGSGAALLAITYFIFARTTGSTTAVIGIRGAGTLPPPSLPKTVRDFIEAQRADQHAQMLRQLLVVSGLALLGMAAFSLLLGWWMAGRALWPVREMTGKAREISEANLHERLDVTGPEDELKELGDTFDGLLSRLQTAFDAHKRFVANASHELRTPLTFQRAVLEVALADNATDAERLREVCQRVLVAGTEQERLIEALLTLARSQRGLDRRDPVDMAAVAARILAERAHSAGGSDPGHPHIIPRQPSVSCDLAPCGTTGDARLLERLVGNLVENAIQYNVPDGWTTVRTGVERNRAVLQVINSGPLIPSERIGLLVQPFQRTEQSRTGRSGGLGLGLSIVAAIAEAHGGQLEIQARAEGGLNVTLTLAATAVNRITS